MRHAIVLAVCLASLTAFAQESNSGGIDLSTSSGGGGSRRVGLRLNLTGGGQLFATPTSAALGPGPGLFTIVPSTVEAKFFVNDDIAITGGLGLGMGISGVAVFGFALGGGVDAHLWGRGTNFRPMVSGSIGFGRAVAPGDTWFMSFQGGGGAEYWFSPHFSVTGRAMLGINPIFGAGTLVGTFMPSISGTFYF